LEVDAGGLLVEFHGSSGVNLGDHNCVGTVEDGRIFQRLVFVPWDGSSLHAGGSRLLPGDDLEVEFQFIL
jgi:hypothetical protein